METGLHESAAGGSLLGRDTIAGVLEQRARTQGDTMFVAFEDAAGNVLEYSYGEMERRAGRLANLLRGLGLGKGDTLHVHLPNCPEFYDCWFAAAKLGAILLPTNPLSTADELAYLLAHAGAGVSISQPDLLPAVAAARDRCPNLRTVLLARTASVEPGTVLLDVELASQEPVLCDPPEIAPSDVAAVLYTSGTTSRPKGVLVTNANYLFVGEAVAQYLRLRPDDRLLIVLPLFHGNAQYYSTMPALVTGASIALIERFSASRWARQAAQHGATVASLFAAPIRMLLAQPPQPDEGENRLRLVLFAQNVTAEQLEEFEQRFGCPLLQIYGMTETVAPPTLNPLYGERRNMSIGRPALWVRVRIVDAESNDVPVGESGQLLVQGEPGRTLMAGYLKDPGATTEAIRDGWLHTGDNVRADEDGYLYFVDRSKDMIKRAGENVASSEVERVVNEHPAVFDSAAIGVPDPMRDEAIKVFVVFHAGVVAQPHEIIDWCAARLAKFKVPSFVEVVESLPRTSVGKIQKHLLPRHPAHETADRQPSIGVVRGEEVPT